MDDISDSIAAVVLVNSRRSPALRISKYQEEKYLDRNFTKYYRLNPVIFPVHQKILLGI